MKINGKPTLYLSQFLSNHNRSINIFPLTQQRCYYFFSARYALSAGIKAVGIEPDDAVLLPSYNCWTEIEPFLHAGIRIVYYRINSDLTINFNDLLKKIKYTNKVKALLVTHFLGFPQPIEKIKDIFKESRLLLIEDCAHAFLSNANGKALGSYGDISIFSLLKTLPVPHGGVLVINNQDITYRHDAEDPNFFSTIYYAAELLKNRTILDNNSYGEKITQILYNGLYYSFSIVRMFLAGFRKYLHPSGLYLVRPDSYIFNDNVCSWGMSAMSQAILSQTDFERVKDIRRKNFQYLLDYFLEHARGDLPFRELPRGVCPLFFPIVLKGPEQRENLYQRLRERGVVTHPWWSRFNPAVPWEDFPDAVLLKQRLFGLPIHQDLTLKHMARIIEEFEKVYNKSGA